MVQTAAEMFRGCRPAAYEVWQVKPIRLPSWVHEKGAAPYRPTALTDFNKLYAEVHEPRNLLLGKQPCGGARAGRL